MTMTDLSPSPVLIEPITRNWPWILVRGLRS